MGKFEKIVVKASIIDKKFSTTLDGSVYEYERVKFAEFHKSLIQLLETMAKETSFCVRDLEKKFAVSNRTLHRKFKKYYQMTPSEVICNFRLENSVKLLQLGYPVLLSCYEVGFNSYSYFYSSFKKVYKCSPSQFQQMNKIGGYNN